MPSRDEPGTGRRGAWMVLAALVAVGLAVRVGLALWLPSDRAAIAALPDQLEYLDLAESLRGDGRLVTVDTRYAAAQPLRAQRMAGYPLFVAALGANVTLVRLAQAGLDVATALAAFGIARRWLTPRPSLVAPAGVLLNPFLAYFSTFLLTETLFACLVTIGLWCVLRADRRATWWFAGIGLLALSVHVRPTGALLAVAVALASVLLPGRHPGRPDSRWPLAAGLTGALMVALVLSPWIWRNANVLKRFVPTTTNGGITLYDGWNPDNTTGGSDQSFVGRMPQLGLMDEVDRSAYLRGKAVEAIRFDPIRAGWLAVKKVGRTWSPVPLSELDSPAKVAAGALFALPLFALAAIGLVAGRLPGSAKLLLVTPAIVLTLAHAATVGSLRYRLPSDPALAVLAAAGAAALLGHWRARRAAAVDEAETELS